VNWRTGACDLLYAELPADLRDFYLCCYLTGWRTGDVKLLLFSGIQDGELHQAEESKNDTIYSTPLWPELAGLIERRKQLQAYSVNGVTQISRYIFHRGDGKSIGDVRKAWKSACQRAGLDGALGGKLPIPHDMRRSAAKNLTRAGVPRSIGKKFLGHKTDAIFDRYAIPDAEDMKWAAGKLEQYYSAQRKKVVAIS
jgi:integrase